MNYIFDINNYIPSRKYSEKIISTNPSCLVIEGVEMHIDTMLVTIESSVLFFHPPPHSIDYLLEFECPQSVNVRNGFRLWCLQWFDNVIFVVTWREIFLLFWYFLLFWPILRRKNITETKSPQRIWIKPLSWLLWMSFAIDFWPDVGILKTLFVSLLHQNTMASFGPTETELHCIKYLWYTVLQTIQFWVMN